MKDTQKGMVMKGDVFTTVFSPVHLALTKAVHKNEAVLEMTDEDWGRLDAGYKVHFSFDPGNKSFPQFCEIISQQAESHGINFLYKYAEGLAKSDQERKNWQEHNQQGKECVVYLVDQKKYDAYAALAQRCDEMLEGEEYFYGDPEEIKGAKEQIETLLPALKACIVTEERLEQFIADTVEAISHKHTFKLGAGYTLQQDEKQLSPYATMRCDRDSDGNLSDPRIGSWERGQYLPDSGQVDDYANVSYQEPGVQAGRSGGKGCCSIM